MNIESRKAQAEKAKLNIRCENVGVDGVMAFEILKHTDEYNEVSNLGVA